MILSKSDYLLFLKHPAWLWLKKHDKAKLAPVDENLQALFDEGYLFESYAQQKFSGGIRIGFTDYDEYLSMPTRTKKALDDGAVTVFQGRFEADGITCICDVIVKNSDGTLDLYEIKSSTEVKPIHEADLAFQLTVLEACGYTVNAVYILYVNSEYVRLGDIDIEQLVEETNITNAVFDLRDETKQRIFSAKSIAESKTMPDISPALCEQNSLKEWMPIFRLLHPVEKGSIYDLCRLNTGLLTELEKRTISMITDIPDDMHLRPQQELQVKVTKANAVHIDTDEIKNFLSGIRYPLYFLDYETLGSVIPPFDGTRPYQQIPFQYSLHVISAPGADVQHTGYLHTEKSNPVTPLTQALMKAIGEEGTVFVWFEGFEKSRNSEMGELVPGFKEFYENLNGRVVDLMTPFSSGWYAHADFLGSASIKKVLPVLVPELSYKTLGIQEGGSAQRIWMETVMGGEHAEEREKIFKDLDEYCTLDTLAMVKIFEKLMAV